jgi:hypothetical protein
MHDGPYVGNLEVVFGYMDDSRFGSQDRQTHLIHLEALFVALVANGFTSIWKSVFLPFQHWKF